jgi:maleate isomerase
LGISIHDQISRKTPDVAYNLVMELYRKSPEADGFFISCTSFRLEEYIDMLEANIKKPVITSIQASAWDALRMSGVMESIKGYGRLLREL